MSSWTTSYSSAGCAPAPLDTRELRFSGLKTTTTTTYAARRPGESLEVWIRHAVASRVRALLLQNNLQDFEVVDNLPLVDLPALEEARARYA
uniref:Uncharacterized protein n=1 Tax=Oryza meridionalis TaxID=40149 RepID=A0A0E0F3A6_9ORYZ